MTSLVYIPSSGTEGAYKTKSKYPVCPEACNLYDKRIHQYHSIFFLSTLRLCLETIKVYQ
ncbi:MAG: hypothetical protein KDC72_09515 [Bacteroidetes bacterium]|nr:hypothetical protein [Bacteroidota bacterium]